MRPPSTLAPGQVDTVFQILWGHFQYVRADGRVLVNRLQKPVKDFLTKGSFRFIAKFSKGFYYVKPGSSYYEPEPTGYCNFDWRDLPRDMVWHVVSGMLTNGHSGRSILRHTKEWDKLNLYCDADKREEQIVEILCELSAYGYIWFQMGGDIWAIEERKGVVV